MSQVLAEARRYAARGVARSPFSVRTSTPTTAGAGRGEWRLGALIEALAEIDGIARIRYTTSIRPT